MNRCAYKRQALRNANRRYPHAVIRFQKETKDPVSVVLKRVCDLYQVRVADVLATNRTREVPYPEIRQVAMTLFMDKLKMSSSKAGSVFFKDHATALWARKKIRGFRQIDRKFKHFTDPLFS